LEPGQHFKKMFPDGFRVFVQTLAHKPQSIRRKNTSVISNFAQLQAHYSVYFGVTVLNPFIVNLSATYFTSTF
jgi:hypothetical protein